MIWCNKLERLAVIVNLKSEANAEVYIGGALYSIRIINILLNFMSLLAPSG